MMKDKILNYLNMLNKLDSYSYSYLIQNFTEKLVNETIEELIEENSDNLSKFEYYVKKVIVCDDSKVNEAFNAYILELSNLVTYTNDDNMRVIREISVLIQNINDILSKYMVVDYSSWIADRIDNFMKCDVSSDDLLEVKKLYQEFCDKRNMMVDGNLRFVIYVAKKFSKVSREFEELVQYGNMGLMKAIEKYDISYDNNFTTYAYYWIMQSITRYGAIDNVPLSVSYRVVYLNSSIKKARHDLTLLYGRTPTDKEVSERLNMSIDTINEVTRAVGKFVSLDDALIVDESEDKLIDFIPDDTVDVEREVITEQLVNDVRIFLKENLNERDYNVICHRYALDGHNFLRLQELGNFYGLSRERVRQIEENAIKKLKGKGRVLKSYIDR